VTGSAPNPSGSSQTDLTSEFQEKRFRDSYLSRHLKVFLAAQIRALRGDLSQTEFGELLGKPQSVVSRLEKQSYGKVNLQTLLDIATKLDIGLIVRFVNFSTFLKWTSDFSQEALKPSAYSELLHEEPQKIEETTPQGVAGIFLYGGLNATANTVGPYVYRRFTETYPVQLPNLLWQYFVPNSQMTIQSQVAKLQNTLQAAEQEKKKLEAENERLKAENAYLRAAQIADFPLPGFGAQFRGALDAPY
jgi:transcriptional regulator with XRE-family HTH domain